jgi:hypothetical protein
MRAVWSWVSRDVMSECRYLYQLGIQLNQSRSELREQLESIFQSTDQNHQAQAKEQA